MHFRKKHSLNLVAILSYLLIPVGISVLNTSYGMEEEKPSNTKNSFRVSSFKIKDFNSKENGYQWTMTFRPEGSLYQREVPEIVWQQIPVECIWDPENKMLQMCCKGPVKLKENLTEPKTVVIDYMNESEDEEKKELPSNLGKNQKPLDEDLKIVVNFEAKSVKFSDNTDVKEAKKFLKLENSIKDIMNKGLKNTLQKEFENLSLQ